MVCRLLEPVGFKTFKIFLSPICCAVYAGSKGLKSIGNLCLRPENKNSQRGTVFVISSRYKMLTCLLSSGLDKRNGFILMALIAEQSSNPNYSRRPQLFGLPLKLKSTSANATIRWRVVLQLIVATIKLLTVATLYQERGFITIKTASTCENILNCWSGWLARNLYCIPVFLISILVQLQITE